MPIQNPSTKLSLHIPPKDLKNIEDFTKAHNLTITSLTELLLIVLSRSSPFQLAVQRSIDRLCDRCSVPPTVHIDTY